jgi:outer membrane protein OmpA-like peptidoglycan-associated protein
MITGHLRIGLVLGTMLIVGACAGPRAPSDALERARGKVKEAAAEATVERYARAELESAQDAFANAERSARRGLSPEVTEHWAYLAEQRAAIARESARLRNAEAEIRAAEAARAQAAVNAAPRLPPVASGATDRSPNADALVTLRDQDFTADGFALKPEAEAGIAQIVRQLQEDPARVARIDGHSDDMGDRSRSLAFSGRRAEAVRGELTRHGIDPRRIAVRAVGDSSPIASNETSIGRERNRRVEIFVLNQASSSSTSP